MLQKLFHRRIAEMTTSILNSSKHRLDMQYYKVTIKEYIIRKNNFIAITQTFIFRMQFHDFRKKTFLVISSFLTHF